MLPVIARYRRNGLDSARQSPMLKAFSSSFMRRGAPDVHSDRADAEPGHPEISARMYRDAIGHSKFHRIRFDGALAARRTAVRLAGSDRRVSRRRFHHGQQERRERLASA